MSKQIGRTEFLQRYYPSCYSRKDEPKKFSIICQDKNQDYSAMIIWPGLNLLLGTESKVHFVYVGYEPGQPQPYVVQEVDQYFDSKSLNPVLLMKQIGDDLLECLGLYCIVGRTKDETSIQHFRVLNPNVIPGYKITEILTLVEEQYFSERREANLPKHLVSLLKRLGIKT